MNEALAGRGWLLKVALLAALGIGLVLGARASLYRLGSLEGNVPTRAATLAAFGAVLIGQLILGYGWRRMVPAIGDPVAAMWSFHAAQPGKYLPLGLGQAAGQVMLARHLAVPLVEAIAGWAAQTVLIIAGGLTVGGLLVLQDDLGPLRWVGLLGPIAATAAWRPWLSRILGYGHRFTSRLPAPDHLPGQRELAEGFGAALAFIALQGAGFVILLDSPGSVTEQVGLVGAYALAAGLSTATPLPAGLGIREGLIVLFCALEPAASLTAAIVLRVWTFAGEALLVAAFTGLVALRRSSPAPSAGRPQP